MKTICYALALSVMTLPAMAQPMGSQPVGHTPVPQAEQDISPTQRFQGLPPRMFHRSPSTPRPVMPPHQVSGDFPAPMPMNGISGSHPPMGPGPHGGHGSHGGPGVPPPPAGGQK